MPITHRQWGVLSTIAANAVPVAGWFYFEWNIILITVLYVLETGLLCAFSLLRLALNECPEPWRNRYGLNIKVNGKRWHGPRRGHEREDAIKRFLMAMFFFMVPFGVVLGIGLAQQLTPREFREILLENRNLYLAAGAMLATFMADFIFNDLLGDARQTVPLHDIFYPPQFRCFTLVAMMVVCLVAVQGHEKALLVMAGGMAFKLLLDLKALPKGEA
jgi:hypothetical protein